ncbi:MAG: DUF5683 domain-containing protein [Bacteroidales bacterium]
MNKLITYLTALLMVTAISRPAFTQTTGPADTTENERSLKRSPLKATLYSAILPGSGQIYNRKYWKAPIVYAGMGAFTYLAIDHQQTFMRFKTALMERENNNTDEFAGILSDEALLNEMDRYRRYRDLNIIGATVFYVLQIIDANVDASLSDFDVSDDLSIRLNTIRSPYRHDMAMSLTLNF